MLLSGDLLKHRVDRRLHLELPRLGHVRVRVRGKVRCFVVTEGHKWVRVIVRVRSRFCGTIPVAGFEPRLGLG